MNHYIKHIVDAFDFGSVKNNKNMHLINNTIKQVLNILLI